MAIEVSILNLKLLKNIGRCFFIFCYSCYIMSCLSVTSPQRLSHRKEICTCFEKDLLGECRKSGDYDQFDSGQVDRVNCNLPCVGEDYRSYCYLNPNKYPNDINSKFDCCTGAKNPSDCSPNYCPSATANCKPVIIEYCRMGNNIIDQKCQRLKDIDLKSYDEIVYKNCIEDTTGNNLNQSVCKEWCRDPKNTYRCENLLRTICPTKLPNDPKWKSICGCYYDGAIYEKFNEDVAAKWQVPPGTLQDKPICAFPQCKLADYQPLDKTCPEISLTQCFQDVNVDARGAIISDLKIKQNVQGCSSKWKIKGGDVPPDNNDDDDDDDDDVPKKTNYMWWIVGGVGTIVVIIIIVAIIYFVRNKKTI